MRNIRITLLSKGEYNRYKKVIPPIGKWWWLRSPGCYDSHAAFVLRDGSPLGSDDVDYADIGVRPALIISNTESKPGDKIKLFGYTWTLLSENLALCDSFIATRRFDSSSNNWKTSELKAWLERWLGSVILSTPRKMDVRDGMIERSDFIRLCDAMETLGNCFCKISTDSLTITDQKVPKDYVDLVSLEKSEDVIAAMKIIGKAYGLSVKIAK